MQLLLGFGNSDIIVVAVIHMCFRGTSVRNFSSFRVGALHDSHFWLNLFVHTLLNIHCKV